MIGEKEKRKKTEKKYENEYLKVQKLNQQQARWALYLSRFNFTLKYVPGTKMEKANSLSRGLDWKIGIENDNENQKLIKKNGYKK